MLIELVLMLTQVLIAIGCFATFRIKSALGGILLPVFLLTFWPSSGLLVLNGVALSVLILVGLCWGIRQKTFNRVAIGASLALLAFAVVETAPLLFDDRSGLQRQYPYRSLADRLASASQRQSREYASPLRQETDANLERLEAEIDAMNYPGKYRTRTLEMIHASYVKRFVDSPGFGFWRGVSARAETIDLEPPKSIPLPESTAPDAATPERGGHGEQAPDADHVSYPEARELQRVHVSGIVDFANPDGFGYVVSVEKVAGFQPHAFRRMPALRNEDRPRWRVTKLELVSLLLHDEPAIYRSENLPRMDELQDVPVRRLDPFEAQALERLQVGEDVVIDESPNAIRMLGSIRAAKQCLQCHQVDRGYLLGAFTYLLRPAAFKPEPPRPEKPRI